MFYIHIPARRLVSLLVCFALSLVLIVGSVFSFSSFHLLDEAVAVDDMMGGPMGGGSSDSGGSDNGGSGGGDQDQGPEPGDEGSGGSSESGDEGSGGSSESGVGGEQGRDNQGGEGSSTGPKAVGKGKCEDGHQYDEFGNCIKAQVAQNPGNDKPTVPTSTTCLQVGKKYDPSSILSAEDNCTIKQVGNPDGSITATIVYPNNPEGKDVIKTDPARNVVIQHNRIDKDGDLVSSAAIDNNGVQIKVEYVGFDRYIDIKDPNGRKIAGVTWEIPHGSVFSGYLNDDEKDGDPTTATSQSGMKTTVKQSGISVDPYYIDVRNPDGSLKTQMILHFDGTVEPGSKWTTPAPVESANK